MFIFLNLSLLCKQENPHDTSFTLCQMIETNPCVQEAEAEDYDELVTSLGYK